MNPGFRRTSDKVYKSRPPANCRSARKSNVSVQGEEGAHG